MPKTVLIVEDEEVLRQSLAELLSDEGFEAIEAADGQAAMDVVLERPVDLVLTDVRMPRMDGMALLRQVKQAAPQTPVIMITAYGNVQSAVSAMQLGAADYLLKPVDFDDMLLKISRTLDHQDLTRTQRVMTEQLSGPSSFHNLIGQSRAMQTLFDTARKLSEVKSNVLLVGESGTGKELFARAVHYNGVTRDKPFVPVNCGAIPDNLVESELYGYRKGAFTGADRDKEGLFGAADGGTLFLDEISTLPLGPQGSLLRAIEEKVIVPVGDTRPRSVDVRIIAASNRNLDTMVETGEFREDLLYRLNVVKLELPPLRAHKEDIPQLVEHFLDKHAREMNRHVTGVSNAAMRAILSYDWPGNVRELTNVIERAVIFADGGPFDVAHLPFATDETPAEAGESLKGAIQQFERQHVIAALRRHDYDKAETARHLAIGVSSLYRKLDELDVPKDLEERDRAKVE